MPNTMGRRIHYVFVLIVLIMLLSGTPSASAAMEAPLYFLPLAAPWPAGVVLHSGGDGYGYGTNQTDTTHKGSDEFAMDFNGNPTNENPPVETADKDLLVLAVADGCVKEVKYSPGQYVEVKKGNEVKKVWYGNYGWNIVIAHPGGYESRYAHLKEKPLISEGSYDLEECEYVAQGHPLGQIGGTGTENNAVHLHLALYYCEKSGESCKIQPVKPEPLDEMTGLPSGDESSIQVKSGNYSVGYEAITGNAISNPASLIRHQPILDEYQRLGGQFGFFGRAQGPVGQIPGTDIFYQEFKPHALQSTFATAIVEVNSRAYMMPQPIWDVFKKDPSKIGNPNTSTYVSQIGQSEIGWRVDFQNASVFWHWSLPNPTIWDKTNAPWKTSFCTGINSFSCNPIRRYDPYADFTFSNSNNSGPLFGTDGFSMLLEATFEEKIISKISLEYELQGNVRFYVEGDYQGDWIQSEDGLSQGITSPKWHVGGNTFAIRFWQSPGKPAHIMLRIHEIGIGFPTVYAFESQGTLESSVLQPSQPEYLDFEPPPYPGEAASDDAPSIVSTPGQPTEIAPGTSPVELPDLGKWWDDTLKKIQDGINLILTSSPNRTRSYPIHTTRKRGIDTPTCSTTPSVTTTLQDMFLKQV